MKIRRKKKRATESDQQALADFLDAPKSKPRGKPRTSAQKGRDTLARLIANAKIRSRDGEWDDAKPRDFVGLFALCHQIVYGIEPIELATKTELMKATRVAKKCLSNFFDDDPHELVEFIKWVWKRQEGKEAWALREGKNLSRLNVFAQFSPQKVSDYRIEIVRSQRKRKK